jgi:exopolysaccharide biosynthesis polyprenyl glycosylphosphotransferase
METTGIETKRRHNRKKTFRAYEYLLLTLLATGSVVLSYFICVWAGVKTDNIDDSATRLYWMIGIFAGMVLSKILSEAFAKNSVFYKSVSSSFGGSIVISGLTDACIWLIVYFSGYWATMKFFFIDFGIYSILAPVVRSALLQFYSKAPRVVVVVSEKEEALLIASKMIKGGRNKDTIRVFFANDLAIDEDAVKGAIDSSDVLYVGRHLRSHLKNTFMSYAVAETYKTAYIVPNTYEIAGMKPDISQADDILMLEAQPLKLTLPQRIVKRAFDIFCSILALIVLSPLIGLTALIIHMQDGGPAIYKQERITMNGRPFMLYKFRSMIVNAEKQTGAVLMTEDDKRLTKFGKFIRKTRLDELPQLWNILKGDMSIVGPRPERPVFVNEFLKKTPAYAYRFNVRAGLTGYAQVRGNYHTDYEDKLRWDLMYIRRYSFITDIWLILLTCFAIFDKRSASGTEKKMTAEEYLDQCGHAIKKSDSSWDIEGK